jgi:hypothetical protein
MMLTSDSEETKGMRFNLFAVSCLPVSICSASCPSPIHSFAFAFRSVSSPPPPASPATLDMASLAMFACAATEPEIAGEEFHSRRAAALHLASISFSFECGPGIQGCSGLGACSGGGVSTKYRGYGSPQPAVAAATSGGSPGYLLANMLHKTH